MLTPCLRCHRHVREHASCPFCAGGSVLASSLPALALGVALAGCGGTAVLAPETTPVLEDRNRNGEPETREEVPPEEEPIRTAPAYGAAPMPPPEAPAEEERPAAAYGGPPSPPGPGIAPPR